CVLVSMGYFFFSSRRRHTRSKRDWSSDVCSSDLEVAQVAESNGAARVRIDDDGVGGAEFSTGHGLSGLAERVASLEGHLTVRSPRGGGTRVEAVIPCAS